jgi:hypothetical protein
MCSEWFQNVLDGNGAPKVFDVFVFSLTNALLQVHICVVV